jgi:hypothetical protein
MPGSSAPLSAPLLDEPLNPEDDLDVLAYAASPSKQAETAASSMLATSTLSVQGAPNPPSRNKSDSGLEPLSLTSAARSHHLQA